MLGGDCSLPQAVMNAPTVPARSPMATGNRGLI
jgi:hypothetical protein